jgi:hypothetical protein
MIVAAGGGGGGGGRAYQTGSPGLPGGVTTVASTTPRGGTSSGGYSVGGAGGAGYPFGGAGGQTFGDDAGAATGGYGGQNYANASVASSTLTAGSGITPGGVTNALYPKSKRGYAGYNGAVIVIFTKSFRSWVKVDGVWKDVNNAYVKVPTSTTSGVRLVPDQTIVYSSLGTTKATVPPNVFSITVTGHGGAGGGGGADGGSGFGGGGGGGGGANRISQTFAVTPGQVLDITVGRGGAGGAGPYGTGGTGLPSTVTGTGVSFTAGGGGGGTNGGNSGTGFSGIGANGANYSTSSRIQAGGTSTNGGADGGNGGATINAAGAAGQNGKVTVLYTGSNEPITITTGGWKQISQAWIKSADTWQPIQTGLSLVPVKTDKVPTSPVSINITVASNTDNYNLADILPGTSYYPGRSIITLTVAANVVVGSATVGTPALIIDGLTTGDTVRLINNGTIYGRGGDGGTAGSYTVTNYYYYGYTYNSKGQPIYGGIIGYNYGVGYGYNYGGKGYYGYSWGKGGYYHPYYGRTTSIPGRPGQDGGSALEVR